MQKIETEHYTEVTSGHLKSVAWKNDNLYVTFKSGGQYVYGNVPKSVYDTFITEDSPGSYYSWFVKGQYPSSQTAFEIVKPETAGKKFKIDFVLEASAEWPGDNLLAALDAFRKVFEENYDSDTARLSVKGISEIE